MSVGAQLHQARKERKLSLGEVSEQTKIQPWVLEALEGDRLQELMSPIYVKGLLTSYARFLHLQPEPLVSQLVWPAPAAEEVQAQLPPPVRQWRVPVRKLAASAAMAAAIGALIVVNPLRWVPKAAPKAAASKPKPAAVSQPKLASVSPVQELAKPPKPPQLNLQAVQPLQLEVSALRTTWIQVRADGKLLSHQRLSPGAREQWKAQQRFEVVVARPSEVEMLLNGQPISPFAIAHRGRLAITRRGIQALPADTP